MFEPKPLTKEQRGWLTNYIPILREELRRSRETEKAVRSDRTPFSIDVMYDQVTHGL